jgi:hypothetical protein
MFYQPVPDYDHDHADNHYGVRQYLLRVNRDW